MINIYSLHANPSQLLGYEQARTRVPSIAWELAKTPAAKKKLEHLWQQDAEFAYYYARNVIKKPWPPGEAAIARDAQLAYYYAANVIRKPWPPGEAAIAGDAEWAYRYARGVIEGPWPPGEAAIAGDDEWAYLYAQFVKPFKDKRKS